MKTQLSINATYNIQLQNRNRKFRIEKTSQTFRYSNNKLKYKCNKREVPSFTRHITFQNEIQQSNSVIGTNHAICYFIENIV